MKDLADKPVKDRLILAAHYYKHTKQRFQTKAQAVRHVASLFQVSMRSLNDKLKKGSE